jgi:hypothetical protein
VNRGLVVLLALAVGLSTQVGNILIDCALLPFAATLLAAHIDREGGAVARAIVRAAARLLPREVREEHLTEWIDHIESAGENGVFPLIQALSIGLLGAPCLAIGLRVGRNRRRAVQ